jgi:hypothetical protein
LKDEIEGILLVEKDAMGEASDGSRGVTVDVPCKEAFPAIPHLQKVVPRRRIVAHWVLGREIVKGAFREEAHVGRVREGPDVPKVWDRDSEQTAGLEDPMDFLHDRRQIPEVFEHVMGFHL